MQTKQVVEVGFYHFLRSFQEAVLEGYRVSDKNEYFPNMSYTGLCTAVLVKEEDAVEAPAAAAEDATAKKPAGRPRKV